MHVLKTIKLVVLCIAVIGVIYIILLSSALGPLNGFWSTDQGTKLIQVQSLIRTQYTTNALIYPGEPFDPDHSVSPLRGTYIEREGQIFSIWSPLFAFLSSVPFFLWGFPGLYVLPIASTLVTLFMSALIGKRLFASFWICCAVLVAGLASPLLFYSMVFWEHTPATCLMLLAFWLLLCWHERNQPWLAIFAGVCAGGAVWLRNELVLGALALAGAWLLVGRFSQWRGLIWYAIGVVPLVGGLLVFNWWVYGVWVGPHILVAGAANYREGWSFNGVLKARRDWAELVLVPFLPPFGWLAASGCAACLVSWSRHAFIRRLGILAALAALVAMSVTGLILLGSGVQTNPQLNGGEQTALLLILPLALFALLPLPHEELHTERRGTNDLAPRALANLLRWFVLWFIALAWVAQIPWGASQWGPRILLPTVPPLVLWSFFVLASWSQAATPLLGIRLTVTPTLRNGQTGPSLLLDPALTIATCLLVVTGLVAQLYGLQMLREVNVRNHHITTSVAQSAERVVVTDTWIAPPLISPLFYDGHIVFIVDDASRFDELIVRLQAEGINDVYYLGDRFPAITAGSRYAAQFQHGEEQRFAYRLSGRTVVLRRP